MSMLILCQWLQEQDLIPKLLSFLEQEYPAATQTSAGDFIKAIITISANASQNEQSCIGPNNLTRQLVSELCIQKLIICMLHGGNPLTVGVGAVIEVIRKNNSDYDPDIASGAEYTPTSNDPIYLGTLLRHFAKAVPNFMTLILSPTHTVGEGGQAMTIKRKELAVASGTKIEPLGFDRFKTCELMAELLHCSNMGLLNERGAEAYVRNKDEERDRLKAEGALQATRPTAVEGADPSEDRSGIASAVSPLGLSSEPQEEIRRLEVANNVDDEGFEDVGSSGDLADDVKDDFDEHTIYELESKPTEVHDLPIRPARPPLDLDEDFVDEPLTSPVTSPRLEAVDEKDAELQESPESLDRRDSEAKTKALETANTDDPLHQNEPAPLDEDALDFAEFEKAEPSVEEPLPHSTSTEAPPLPHRDRLAEPETDGSGSTRELSPHPEDKPPPLFASTTDQNAQPETQHHDDSTDGIERGPSQDMIDTTLGEEGDSARSVLMSGTDLEQSFAPHIEDDVDGQPLVGDYMKMMFVEHQVVPTILVSRYTNLQLQRMSGVLFFDDLGFLLSIPLEQFSSQCSI